MANLPPSPIPQGFQQATTGPTPVGVVPPPALPALPEFVQQPGAFGSAEVSGQGPPPGMPPLLRFNQFRR